MARHPRLTARNAVQILDLLAKVYLYDPVYVTCALRPFFVLAERYRENPLFLRFIGKLVEVQHYPTKTGSIR